MSNRNWAEAAQAVVAELYGRIPESQPRPRLEPTMLATQYLGMPQHNYGVIHITGTNGKTSTARIAERILRELGLRTGRLTSPHLVSINERVSLDGEPISDETLVLAYEEAAPLLALADEELIARGEAPLTFFEAFTALALQIFSDAPIDVAILEVGMGGEWDSTNVADADVAVFTAIDLDHQKSLGNTVVEIATTKAGIIKSESLVVSSPQLPQVTEVLKAKSQFATPYLSGAEFSVTRCVVDGIGTRFSYQGLTGNYENLWMPILGAHQAENAATAIAAVEAFIGAGKQPINEEVLRSALADATSPGRLQVLSREPLVVLDGAHNAAGARSLAKAWRDYLGAPPTIGVISMLQDKNVADTLQEFMGLFESVIVTQADSPRAMSASELAKLVEGLLGDRVTVEANLQNAWKLANELAKERDCAVLVTGSLYLTGNVLALHQAANENQLESEDYEED